MELFQLVLAIVTAFASIGGGVVYWLKKRSDGKYLELESRLKIAASKADSDLEKVKADTAQALANSESIKSLTGVIGAQVEERRESTVATKENTAATNESVAAVKALSTSIDGMIKDERLVTLTTAVTELVKSQMGTTAALKEVAAGQDELEILYKAFAQTLELVWHRLNSDNRKFAAYILRPDDDASKQGIEDIAAGKAEAAPPVVAVTA